MSKSRIALSATEFAELSEEDFGHALYQCDWVKDKDGFARGVGAHRGLLLHVFVAQRAGLSLKHDIAFRDKNPLNCQRENIYATTFVWKKGAVKRRLDAEGDEPEFVEAQGWTFGNVGLCQKVKRNGDWWSATHLPTGFALQASWPTLESAKAAVEAMHAEGNLEELDKHESFKKKQLDKWARITTKHRVGVGT
jgi:hypothetical protein